MIVLPCLLHRWKYHIGNVTLMINHFVDLYFFKWDLFFFLFSFSSLRHLLVDSMNTLCKNSFLQMIYRKTDGAILWSQNERNLDCSLTFQTHSILQRFMVRFDVLQLDCNDHLFVYDGAHSTGIPKVNSFISTLSLSFDW